MNDKPFSVILLPTLECNVACDYCFEDKSKIHLSHDKVPQLATQLLNHMVKRGSKEAQLYWQGGEVLMLGPQWFERTKVLFDEAAAACDLTFRHYMQTNLIGWSSRWHDVVKSMFNGSLGTSMDYPNDHRRLKNGSTEKYTELWLKAVREAQGAGINVGVIAVLHPGSLRAGARAFYDFYIETAGITDFQVNMPFPGGPGHGGDPLDSDALGQFMVDLMDVWAERGFKNGISVGPFSELFNSFSGRQSQLPCIWQQNCANEFIAIDARGQSALCDCWVTSYPQHSFGNAFAAKSLSEMLGSSKARERFLERPAYLMSHESCGTCEWLSMCHGGCPVRTFTAKGTIFTKDPYCEVYQRLFDHARRKTAELVREQVAVGAL